MNKSASVWIEALRKFEDGEPRSPCERLIWMPAVNRGTQPVQRIVSGDEFAGPAYSIKGFHDGHIVLDREIGLRWILDGLTLPPETVTDMAGTQWARLSEAIRPGKPDDDQAILDLKQLRRMKHRLTAAQALPDSRELPPDSVIRAWLPLKGIPISTAAPLGYETCRKVRPHRIMVRSDRHSP